MRVGALVDAGVESLPERVRLIRQGMEYWSLKPLSFVFGGGGGDGFSLQPAQKRGIALMGRDGTSHTSLRGFGRTRNSLRPA